jgi:outer membrane protein OmpA-like peptidoglycan-associated protein
MLKKLLIALVLAPLALGAVIAAGNHDTAADVYFRFDKSEITATGNAVLENLKEKIAEPQCAAIRIVGHACELGTEEYNNGLGMRRAEAIRDWLVRKGFNFDNIIVETVGQTDPIVPSSADGSHNPKNRVAEIYILPRDSWYRDFKCKQEIRDQRELEK